MSKQRSIHLFNCDRTYKLDAVEDWLKATKPKLESVEQHYFPLAKMSEMSNETIPGLQMDLAVFVVHAHESCLSINEPNAGIGYAKIYRALLQATENVIIVIGGDDNYKNEDEEDKEFISRWAKIKVSSQFSEEYMDGRKSFIFSWNQKHRDIHEEALRHLFDSRKKGQKFEYQPKQRLPPKPSTPPLKAQDKGQSSRIHSAFIPERTSTKDTIATPGRNEAWVSGFHGRSNQVPRPNEVSPACVGKTLHKDLAIIGCKVFHRSEGAVRQVLDNLRSSLNISNDVKVKNFSPVEAVSYLLEKPPRFCVLVVDAATVQDAYEELPRRREYELLLTTAANNVVEKVIVMICGPCSLSSERDEAIFTQTVGSVFRDTGKGFVVWVKDNQIAVEPKVLLEMILNRPTSSFENTQPKTSYHGDFSSPTKPAHAAAANISVDRKLHAEPQGSQMTRHRLQETPHHPLRYETNASMQPSAPPSRIEYVPAKREFVMLKTRLFSGVLSDRHVEICHPGFIVPDYINESLYRDYAKTPDAFVEIIQDKDGKLRWSVELKSKSRTSQNVSMSRPTSSFENTKPNTSYPGDFSSPTKPAQAAAANVSVDRGRRTEETPHDPLPFETNLDQLQNASMQPFAPPGRIEYVPPKGEYVMLKTRLFSGVLSAQHVEICYPGFIVPDYVSKSLYQDYANTPDAVVKIIQDKDGKLRWSVDLKNKSKTSQKQDSPSVPGDEYLIDLKANETVVLITRVRYGQISLEKGDVRLYQQNWEIPDYLVKSLSRDYKSMANGELYVISDENEKLRFKLFKEKGRIASRLQKAGKLFKETFN